MTMLSIPPASPWPPMLSPWNLVPRSSNPFRETGWMTNRVIDGSPLPLDMQQERGQRVSAHTFRGLQKPEDGRLTESVSARAPEGLASACAYSVLSP